jgi:1,4-dihydroxy-2-naphthoate octaprenyltransferase
MARALRIWLLAVRFPSLTASVIPVLAGTAVVADEAFRPGLFGMALVGSMALQAGTNLINDYFDHIQGADTDESLGPSGVIQLGLLSPRMVLIGGLVAFAIGAALGIAIAAIAGWALLPLGIASVLAGYAYTAPPLKLAYRGLGEATSFAFMGPVIVMGAAYVQIEAFTWEAFLASLPIGFLVATILHANNLRDIDDDRAHDKRTLASLVGRPAADYELIVLIAAAFVSAAMLAGTGSVSRYGLISLLALPMASRTVVALRASQTPRSLNRVLLGTVGLHLAFGLLWSLGLALDAWVD